MSQISECATAGEHFKLLIPILVHSFKASIPFINGAEFKLTFTDTNGIERTTDFNCGHHYETELHEESIIHFQVKDIDLLQPLLDKSGLEPNLYISILFAEHLYLQTLRKDKTLANPLSEAQIKELEKQGIKLNFGEVDIDNAFLYIKEGVYIPYFDDRLTLNQINLLGEATDLNAYVDHIRQEMLELYLFINDWKSSDAQSLTLKCGAKTMKLNNFNNWTFTALNEYINKYLGETTVEEVKDDLAFNYTKKTGRKINNKFQTLMIYGIDSIYLFTAKNDEITNQECEFIRDYLKYIGLPISKDDFDHDDDIKNIRSKIRYLRKNDCSETWGAPSTHLETITNLNILRARGK